mgnify:CR=1 FL=1
MTQSNPESPAKANGAAASIIQNYSELVAQRELQTKPADRESPDTFNNRVASIAQELLEEYSRLKKSGSESPQEWARLRHREPSPLTRPGPHELEGKQVYPKPDRSDFKPNFEKTVENDEF